MDDTEQQVADQQRATLGKLVKLTLAKRELDAKLKEAKEEIKAAEEAVLSVFGQLGVSAVTVDGYTLSPHIQLWAGAGGDYPTACAALVEAGLGDFVQERFNTSTVSSWVREQPRTPDGQPILPEALKGKLLITEKHKVGVVKAKQL